MAKQKVADKKAYNRPNFWGMIQGIFIAAINKGQLLLLGAMFILMILIIKLPSNEASNILHELIRLIESYHILGWLFSVLLLISLVYTGKRLRRSHSTEISRLSEEKKKLQELLFNKKLKTSK